MAKLAWVSLQGKKQWAKFINARFYSKGAEIRYHKSSSIWKGIRVGLSTIGMDIAWSIGSNSECNFWFDS
ncbi:hypothetical protein ACHQM5_009220 [Ranunculus cassubicifolius]